MCESVALRSPVNYSPEENYDIYLEIDKKIYVPFPVLNQTAIPEKYRKANAAFSMIIEKRIFDRRKRIQYNSIGQQRILYQRDRYYLGGINILESRKYDIIRKILKPPLSLFLGKIRFISLSGYPFYIFFQIII